MGIFKENLKLIVNTLIESICKEKLSNESIKQTIQEAYDEIYRGKFEAIKELDEEQLYSSIYCSGNNTERRKSEAMPVSMKKGTNEERAWDKPTDTLTDEIVDSKLLISDIYDRSTSDNKNQHEIEANPGEANDKTIKGHKKHESIKINDIDKLNDNNTNDSANQSDVYKDEFAEACENEYSYSNEKWDNNNDTERDGSENTSLHHEFNTNSDKKQNNNKHNIHPSLLKNSRRVQMRSFDQGLNGNIKEQIKMCSLRNTRMPKRNLKKSSQVGDNIKPSPFLKEQYHTTMSNNIRKEKSLHLSKPDLNKLKNKPLNKNSAKEYHLKLSLNKFHARNRSANSINRKRQVVDTSLSKRLNNQIEGEHNSKEDEETDMLRQNNFYKTYLI